MHHFSELILRSTNFTLNAICEAHQKIVESVEHSAATSLVRGLQMLQLQKAIIATGMFSMFDAEIQRELSCENGFKAATEFLDRQGKTDLKNRFGDFILAINVLKHGTGRSYKTLVAKSDSLPFRIKLPGENFFFEGDVSEADTLIEVDDQFVLNCAELIDEVSKVVESGAEDSNQF